MQHVTLSLFYILYLPEPIWSSGMDAIYCCRHIYWVVYNLDTNASIPSMHLWHFHQKLVNKMHIGTLHINKSFKSRDSVVGIATGYGLDDQGIGVRVPVGARIFSSPRRPDGSGAHPASYPVGTWGKAAGA
jgi:hypothetical protein